MLVFDNVVANFMQAVLLSAYALATHEIVDPKPNISQPGDPETPNLPIAGILAPSESCVDFTGDWRRSYDGIVISLVQTGCIVKGGLAGHKYALYAGGDVAFGNVHRTSGDCTTIATAKITKLSDNQIRELWLGTDGNCDLDVGFTQDFTYDKL